MATATFNIDLVVFTELDNVQHGMFDEDVDDIACTEMHGPQYIKVADGATDQAINLGPLTTAYLVAIVTDQALTFKHNSSATPITARANEPFAIPTVTALTVSNGSGTDAYVKVLMAGV